jgi:hypothetical protein
MNPDFNNLDPVETLLRDCSQAEQAGVFNATRIDTTRLAQRATVDGSSSLRLDAIKAHPALWRFRWLSVAAAVALAIGVGGWLFSHEIHQIRGRLAIKPVQAQTCDEALAVGCQSGPARSFVAGCEACDTDHDGDVDLFDRGRLQLAVVAAAR